MPVHRVILPRVVFQIENLINLDKRARIRVGASRWHIGCVFNLTALLL